MSCRIDRIGLEEGIIGVEDIPQNVTEYASKYNMPIDCLWSITVAPNKMVSNTRLCPQNNMSIKFYQINPICNTTRYRSPISYLGHIIVHCIY